MSMGRAGSVIVIRSRSGQAAEQHIATQARNRYAGQSAELGLGLKLESIKASVAVLVIDSVEKPSPN